MYQQRPQPEPGERSALAAWLPEMLREAVDELPGWDDARVLVQPSSQYQDIEARPDRYLVVDELGDGYCRLTVDPWPMRDGSGRLWFGSAETDVLTVDLADFQRTVDHHRRRYLGEEDEAAERPIRIGDTFAVYTDPRRVAREFADRDRSSEPPEPDDPFDKMWRREIGSEPARLVDVTAAARQASHAAAEAAATGTLTQLEAFELGYDQQASPRDTSGFGPEDEPPLQGF